jgi:EPS-associated MarR family transcriptional regulator
MNHDSKLEIRYRLLNLLADDPSMRQKDMARRMGVSVGLVNFCLRELALKGLIKIHNYKNAMNRVPYTYALTPRGIEEKGRITVRFLKRKIEEYEEIKHQIALLTQEVEENGLHDLVKAEPNKETVTV